METLFRTSLVRNSEWSIHEDCSSTPWTKEENKRFESALAIFDEKTPNRWYKVAAMIPGKSVYDVMNQYRVLVADVSDIEKGLVPIPGYLAASSFAMELADHRGFDVYRKKGRTYDQERKKGVPWTQEEHRRFLLGLQKHGKGDWRNISRNFVISKTPTQVASHAQKYYLRQQLSSGKDKRRPSIHDITTVDLNHSTSQAQVAKTSLLGKSDETSMKTHANTLLDWSCKNTSALMVFDSACGDSLVAYPRSFATRGRYIVNIGDSGPGFHVQ